MVFTYNKYIEIKCICPLACLTRNSEGIHITGIHRKEAYPRVATIRMVVPIIQSQDGLKAFT